MFSPVAAAPVIVPEDAAPGGRKPRERGRGHDLSERRPRCLEAGQEEPHAENDHQEREPGCRLHAVHGAGDENRGDAEDRRHLESSESAPAHGACAARLHGASVSPLAKN